MRCSGRASRSRRNRLHCSGLSRSIRRSSTLRSAVPVQLRDDQPARSDQEHAGRRRRRVVGAAGLCDARLGPDRQADRPQSDHRRHHQGHPIAKRPGRGRPYRRAADLQRPAAAAQHSDQGAADLGRRVRKDRRPDQPGRLDTAARRCRAARTGGREPRPRDAVQRRPGRRHRDLSDTRCKRDRHPEGGPRPARASCRNASPTIWRGR